ncbi:spindolin [Grimontia sp. AD028]|uniref:lytic polysaccharide monooxygenase n=1 Tax=Grimontia sp. AD028 TaxID=1581149 RepID=UPI00061AE85C|nr:lytic polysaccharide monooxygenase [Grimontia sp. AD028]KKD62109.1 spindolin [Grimontia sp. AD028]
MLRTRLLPLVAVVSATIPQLAFAHGYMDYPPARQEICDSDGGYWESTDGSTIPNAACRAAFKESGWYPFVQKPEFAKLVSNFTNQAAVEAGVPDGALCSAGDPKKAGIDIPSSEWQATPIDPSLNGKLTLLYRASTPHNPSFWKFYLSNAAYNSATDALKWSDLDLIAEFGNVPVVIINEKKYYQMTITLPTDRTGNAVLYSRWQRDDPAGEGFYNCSDISFGGDIVVPTWQSLGAAVKATDDANNGDTVWFRVFDGSGTETVFEKVAIDVTNQDESVWASQLADIINNGSTGVRLGKLSQDGLVSWDSADLYGNLVYVKDQSATFQLDIKREVVNNVPALNAPLAVSVESGQSTQIAVSATDADNDVLTFSASQGTVTVTGNDATISYTAPATTTDLNDTITVTVTDGTASAEAVISVNVKGSGSTGGETNWDANATYLAGDKVTHFGVTYTAQWWNKGEEPGTSSVWVADKGAGDQAWSKDIAYSGGDTVVYETKTYKAKWWTKGDLPTNGGPWAEVK